MAGSLRTANGVALLFIWFLVFPACGSDYYVNAATGSDANNGTSSESPWQTLQKAADAMPAGGTCYVAPGLYPERVLVRRPGTPLTFRATAPGAVVHGITVNGSTTVSYVIVDGFEITLPRQASLDDTVTGTGVALLDTLNCEVRNCYIHHTLREGVRVFASNGDDSNQSSGNRIVGNRIAYAGGYAGIVLNGAGQIVEDNEISHTIQHPLYPALSTADGADADGIKFAGRGHVFRGNRIHGISPSETGNVDPHIDALQTYGPAYNILIERNEINLSTSSLAVQGVMIEQIVSPVHDITLRYNVVTAYRGFNAWGLNGNQVAPIPRVTVTNNTFFGVRDYDIELHDCPESVVKNNIISVTGHYMSTNSDPATDRNGVPGALPLYAGDLRIDEPRFVDPASGDFHLQSTSPLIDQGADLGEVRDFDGRIVPQGLAPDIGAFEFPQSTDLGAFGPPFYLP